ncbi:methylated-DNA--[protein]-cysteine S-methyltransferase [Janibacter limosus]|uniref:methylated-DNA--[protein]-cysteine S-methyltransferase n=2 Tax=Janibacter limosus TaxID=53458 RepID=A0A4P6MY36_9MICO|nr:methylated-DNA--[protein]-cysteine S-methyltransferase [Janibacter limosus]
MIDIMTTRHARLPTRLGELTAVLDEACTGEGPVLIGLYFPGHWTLPEGADHGPEVAPTAEPVLGKLAAQLEEYLAGERRDFDIPIELRGGEHHQHVWALLEQIPHGETVSYGDLARETGSAAQAVGRAVGANPISILVPCHRVIGADGSITGYAGGLDRKRALLALEEPPAEDRGALF